MQGTPISHSLSVHTGGCVGFYVEMGRAHILETQTLTHNLVYTLLYIMWTHRFVFCLRKHTHILVNTHTPVHPVYTQVYSSYASTHTFLWTTHSTSCIRTGLFFLCKHTHFLVNNTHTHVHHVYTDFLSYASTHTSLWTTHKLHILYTQVCIFLTQAPPRPWSPKQQRG